MRYIYLGRFKEWVATRDYVVARKSIGRLGRDVCVMGIVALIAGVYLDKSAGIVGGALFIVFGLVAVIASLPSRDG